MNPLPNNPSQLIINLQQINIFKQAMQLNNFRHKRKNLSKALESISVPYSNHQNLKLLTENSESRPVEPKESLKAVQNGSSNAEDRAMKGLRRYYRYKQNTEEEKDTSIGKYRSLELNRRGVKKRSEHKINLYNSIENSPYKPIREKKSANNLQALQHLAEPNYINKVLNRENRKSSLQKKFNLNAPKVRDSIVERHKRITSSSSNQLKDLARIQMKKNNYGYALKLLEKANDGSDSDAELLDLQGICFMNMKQFAQALAIFTKVLALDKQYNKQLYISLALCQNQLNHAQKCMFYINQCIEMFPDYYQGFYFKGKILYKQGFNDEAIKELKEASSLNPYKKQIKLLMGQCYEKSGNYEMAAEYYDASITELDSKNIKYAVKMANMQFEIGQQSQAAITFERCITFIDGLQNRNSQIDEYFLECSYILSLIYYRHEKFEQALMKGEQILKSMNSYWILKAIKIMVVIKIRQHNFYGAIYLIERLDHFKVNLNEIQEYIIFCEGVVLLMKKKIPEGLAKLQNLNEIFCKKQRINELNHQINRVYHMYLYYSYFLIGKYLEALAEIQKQKIIGVDSYYEPILRYNEIVCKAIIQYNTLNYQKANQYFEESLSIFPDKTESKLYIAITNFKLYFKEQLPQVQILIKSKIMRCLNSSTQAFSQVNSNYAANIFYYRGLLHAWNGEWAQAACDLDVAIDKAQDNFINFFYLRALVLANLQNYKQAINDVSVALSIEEDNASCYLLRARCLQIDGNPTQAFADLQTFIALRPQDRQIHKFAGHMLFENGAFEDALQAYSQGDIHKDDLQVYLTRSKTYFLIGNFIKSSADMLQAARIKHNEVEYIFDYEMIKWVGDLFHQYVKNQSQDDYVFKKECLMANLENLNKLYNESVQNSAHKYGKIFKLTEYLTLSSICYFYLGDYNKAIDHFIEVIDLKKISLEVGEEAEGQFEEQQAQKLVFINQMYFNIAICFCMMKDYPGAERYLKKCEISQELHSYEIYQELLEQIKGAVEVDETENYMDLFSLRNKISKYIPKMKVPFLSSKTDKISYREIKLCIPYPKVEPPEINPKFNVNMVTSVDINQIERRPEAPWIFKEKNSVKFTDRIDVYSRFEMEKSEIDKSAKRMHMGDLLDSSSSDQKGQFNLKKQLRLDSQTENKLNKLLNKKK